MTKTKLSDLGSSVCVDDQYEKYMPALGDGTAIPGDLCYIDPADGKAKRTDIAAQEFFSGILMESKITGTETAPVAGVAVRLVVPKSGHGYRIRCTIIADAVNVVGGGATFSNDAGKADVSDITLILSFIGQLALEAAVGDTIIEINWK